MKTIRIGRLSTNDFVINDLSVSRTHAVITIDNSQRAVIKDLNSTQGTYINNSNRRITTDTPISLTDTLRFGNFTTTLSDILQKQNKTVIKKYPANGQKTIGKSPDNTIVMNFDDVSRKHAVIYKNTDGKIIIEDLNSTNGTFVNGVKITSYALRHGDKVTITKEHPLDWENLFGKTNKPGTNSISLYIKIAACIIVCALTGLGIYFSKTHFSKWNNEKIYKEYHSAVCWVYIEYGYKIYVDNSDLTVALCNLCGINGCNGYISVSDNKLKPTTVQSQGTAFFISNDGKLATNLHIARPWLFDQSYDAANGKAVKNSELIEKWANNVLASYATIDPRYNRCKLEVKGELIALYIVPDGLPISNNNAIECEEICGSDDTSKDVAVLQTKTRKLPVDVTNIIDINNADTSDDAITEGKTVFTIGFPYGTSIAMNSNNDLKNQVHAGTITQDLGKYEFGHDAATAGGASGSPIINDHGRLIGVHHAGLTGVTGAQGFNYGIKVKYLLDLLK